MITEQTQEADTPKRPAPLSVGQPARPPKTAEIIATSVRRGIVTGALKEGDTLPSEVELMNQFAVSRPTLREAFRILETESLISIRRGARGGAQVMAPDLSVASRYVGLLLQMSGTTIGEVFESRAVLEIEAARLLAVRRTEKDIAELNEVLDAMRDLTRGVREKLPGALAQWTELAWNFHALVMERSGNRPLNLQWAMMRDIIETHTHSTVARSLEHPETPETVRKTLRSYEKLIALVQGKDATGATQHWRAHMEVSAKILAGRAESQAIVDLFA